MYIVEQVDDEYYIATACGTKITYYEDKEKAQNVARRMNEVDHIRVESITIGGYTSHKLYVGYECICSFKKLIDAVHMKNKMMEIYKKGMSDALQLR